MKDLETQFAFRQFNERSILIQGPSKIDEILLESLLLYKKSIENFYNKLIVEVILSYNSLLIYYVSTIEDVYNEIFTLRTLFFDNSLKITLKKRLWKIPVCYTASLAPELPNFAAGKSMSIDEVVTLHTTPIYTVYFIGFLPGFLYLGGLDNRLALPRKATPSLKLKKGSVAIGGSQTGIYPCDSPGGWHVIGKCPIDFFDPNVQECCFVTPGDRIQFISISEKKYSDISLLVKSKLYTVESEIL